MLLDTTFLIDLLDHDPDAKSDDFNWEFGQSLEIRIPRQQRGVRSAGDRGDHEVELAFCSDRTA